MHLHTASVVRSPLRSRCRNVTFFRNSARKASVTPSRGKPCQSERPARENIPPRACAFAERAKPLPSRKGSPANQNAPSVRIFPPERAHSPSGRSSSFQKGKPKGKPPLLG
eukprot:85205-Prorocentrum_minimum.AAC.1